MSLRSVLILLGLCAAGLVLAACTSTQAPKGPLPPGYKFTPSPASSLGNGIEEWCSGPNRIFVSTYEQDVEVSPNDVQCGGVPG